LDNSIEINFSVPPDQAERTAEEEEELIERMTRELSEPPVIDRTETRLEALQGFRPGGPSKKSEEGPGDAPIFDPYEFATSSSESEEDSEDSD